MRTGIVKIGRKMNSKFTRTYLLKAYFAFLLVAGGFAMAWACYTLPIRRLDQGLLLLAIVTVFLGSNLRIQLLRTKIFFTISDALVFLTLLWYGVQAALIVAVLESGFASWNLHREGVTMRGQTAVFNLLVASCGVFATNLALNYLFGVPEHIVAEMDLGQFAAMLATMSVAQFCVNSVLVSAFVSMTNGTAIWNVWNKYCLGALAMFVSGGAMAGVSVRAIEHSNVLLFCAVLGFFGIIYLTYRRYANDVKRTAEKAEVAERQRVSQAEEHLQELRHYVSELERSGQALRESREKFRLAAYHDTLTGLPNRNKFIEVLDGLIKSGDGLSNAKFALLFLDLDRFKTVNDSLGHSRGDEMIRQVGYRLNGLMLSREGLVGRFSGDEFAILLTEINSIEDATRMAESVSTVMSEPFIVGGRRVFTNVTIGIALSRSKYKSAEEVLRDADIAMYFAKDHQKNYVIFDEKMHVSAVEKLELETDLRLAIERDQLELFYQPIMNLENMTLAGFEALVRWNHPTRGLISPDDFIKSSEDTGLIVPMTIQILRMACSQLAEWRERGEGNRLLTMSVNVSGRHFTEGDIVTQIKSVLEETGLDPSSLKIEITESAVMGNAEQAIATLHKIKEAGVRLSIDDFGTGYSSLSYLHRFPIDALKIDRSFVSTMEDGSENGEIVNTVITLASRLKLNVVAEGIESIHQLHQLRILGSNYGQGFLFSRPLPAKEIERLLDDKQRWQNVLPLAELVVLPNTSELSFIETPQ